MAKAAGDAVRNGDIVIHPKSLEPRWFAWVDDMHDWCISRQLWWVTGSRSGTARMARRCVSDRTRRHRMAGFKIRTYSTPGSPQPCGRSPTMGWPDRTPELEKVLSDKCSRHRLRHPVLLGGANGDVRDVRLRRRRGHPRRRAWPQVPFQNVFLHGLIRGRTRPQDEQVPRKRDRSAGLGGDVRRRCPALHACAEPVRR